jgi:2,5-furandicarboxylate decarboxylase 1
MAYTDLRDFLRRLEAEGELTRVYKPVDRDLELSAVIRCAGEQAVLCERIRGFDVPVVASVFGNSRKVALALEVEPARALWEFIARSSNPVAPEIVAEGPVHEVMRLGEEVDLEALPVPWVHEQDGGRFICAGLVVARDPAFGTNVSIQRLQIKGRAKTGIYIGDFQHLALYYRRAEERGERLPVAVVIGCEPSVYLASQMRGDPGLDEYAVAGGLRQGPVELVRCKTVDLEVPATAEYVIEGYLAPGEREDEGPFGEAPGYYTQRSGGAVSTIVHCTAITHRRAPIFQTLYLAKPPTENNYLTSLPKAASLYRQIRDSATDVRDIYFTPGGCGTFHVVISLKKHYEGEARAVISAALASRIHVKQVIVVDEDIDVRNPHDVEWAVATRSEFDVDGIILTDVPSGLNPAAPHKRGKTLGTRVGIDATRRLGEPFPEVCSVSSTLVEQVRSAWAEYVRPPVAEGAAVL